KQAVDASSAGEAKSPKIKEAVRSSDTAVLRAVSVMSLGALSRLPALNLMDTAVSSTIAMFTLISEDMALLGAENGMEVMRNMTAVLETLQRPSVETREVESAVRKLEGIMVEALRTALYDRSVEDGARLQITGQMMKDMLSSSVPGVAAMLVAAAFEHPSEVSVYVVKASDVSADVTRFEQMVTAMNAVNSALGRNAYKVVVVGQESDINLNEKYDMIEYAQANDLMSNIEVKKEAWKAEAEKITITGIAREYTDVLLNAICDIVILVGEEGSIFGRALFVSLNFRSVTDKLTQAQIQHLTGSAEQKGQALTISAEYQDTETDETIDDYLFADLTADTAF
ncbi:MAG: hypothetical protein KAG97_13780, partial [Victivallales bacterium]|nr:hypothetical protein [Victivallales bacterium]